VTGAEERRRSDFLHVLCEALIFVQDILFERREVFICGAWKRSCGF
jgi:hypothetical protein